MALPILVAAANLIGMAAAKALLKKGGQAALKKVVNNAKGVKRLTKKATEGQEKIDGVAQYGRAPMKSKVKALAVGAGAGAAATKASKDKPAKPAKPATTSKPKPRPDQRTNPSDFPTYKKGTTSAKAFQSAFAAAKKEGKKTFKFEGRTYKVETKK